MEQARKFVEEGRRLARKAEELEKAGKPVASKQINYEAIMAFTKAIKLDPGEYRYYLVRSQCYSRTLQFEKALVDAETALKLNPSELQAYCRKGNALVGLKRFDEAELCFLQMLEHDPECDEAMKEFKNINLYRLIDLGYQTKDCEAALEANFNIYEDALEYLQNNASSQKAAIDPSVIAPKQQQNPTLTLKPTEQPANLNQSAAPRETLDLTHLNQVPFPNLTHLNQVPFPNFRDQTDGLTAFAAEDYGQIWDMPIPLSSSSISPSVPLSIGADLFGSFQPIQDPFAKPAFPPLLGTTSALQSSITQVNNGLVQSSSIVQTSSNTVSEPRVSGSSTTLGSVPNTARITAGTPPPTQNGVEPKSAATVSQQVETNAARSQQAVTPAAAKPSETPKTGAVAITASKQPAALKPETKEKSVDGAASVAAPAPSRDEMSTKKEDQAKISQHSPKVVVVPTVTSDRGYLTDPRNPRGIKSINLLNVQGVTEDFLRKKFEQCGRIISTRVIPEKNVAFVNFADPSSAAKAVKTMSGCINPRGIVMRVTYQDPDYQKPKTETPQPQANGVSAAKPTGSSEPTAIWIGNLYIEDEAELVEMFEGFGKILSKKYDDEKGYGIVQFSSPQAARTALETMNGKYMNGARLNARYREAQVCKHFKNGSCPVANCVFRH